MICKPICWFSCFALLAACPWRCLRLYLPVCLASTSRQQTTAAARRLSASNLIPPCAISHLHCLDPGFFFLSHPSSFLHRLAPQIARQFRLPLRFNFFIRPVRAQSTASFRRAKTLFSFLQSLALVLTLSDPPVLLQQGLRRRLFFFPVSIFPVQATHQSPVQHPPAASFCRSRFGATPGARAGDLQSASSLNQKPSFLSSPPLRNRRKPRSRISPLNLRIAYCFRHRFGAAAATKPPPQHFPQLPISPGLGSCGYNPILMVVRR